MKRRWPFRTAVPVWLRRVTPWWLLTWIGNRYHLCWAEMVMWKMFGSGDWRLRRDCFHPYDYCFFYDHCTPEERREGLEIAGESEVYLTFEEDR